LADLETKVTPPFKHPPMRGQSELEQITLLGELEKLDDLYNPNALAQGEMGGGGIDSNGHFNVDNNIVREMVKTKIKEEME